MTSSAGGQELHEHENTRPTAPMWEKCKHFADCVGLHETEDNKKLSVQVYNSQKNFYGRVKHCEPEHFYGKVSPFLCKKEGNASRKLPHDKKETKQEMTSNKQ